MTPYYEIVWVYGRSVYFLARYTSKQDALHAFRRGKPRIRQLIYGGALRLEKVVDAQF